MNSRPNDPGGPNQRDAICSRNLSSVIDLLKGPIQPPGDRGVDVCHTNVDPRLTGNCMAQCHYRFIAVIQRDTRTQFCTSCQSLSCRTHSCLDSIIESLPTHHGSGKRYGPGRCMIEIRQADPCEHNAEINQRR